MAHRVRSVVLVVACCLVQSARADIYRWEYIDPSNPSLGKKQSLQPTWGGFGVDAVPNEYLFGRDLTKAYLIGADLTNAYASRVNLTNADLSNAILAGTRFDEARFTDAVLAGANIQSAEFGWTTARGFTSAQLYSTASYQANNLTGVGLRSNNLTGWNFAGLNLTSTTFRSSQLVGADFSDSIVNHADLSDVRHRALPRQCSMIWPAICHSSYREWSSPQTI
jgi:hypothetical protein